MLNSNNERELAYLTMVDDILPIIGADRVEDAVVGGWHVMVPKGQVSINDIVVYFEIDSHVDTDIEAFNFLERKHGNIKTQRYTFGGKGNMVSQGLILPLSAFGWSNLDGIVRDTDGNMHYLTDDSRFVTKELNVTYAVFEDNARKASTMNPAKVFSSQHPKFCKSAFGRFVMKHALTRKIVTCFTRTKKYREWPEWVAKTDEERVQNMPWILSNKSRWIATEKIDGTSTTFTMKRGLFRRKMYICSRNVVFEKPTKDCFYETNVYWEMAQKYNIYHILDEMLKYHPEWEWVTIQGETFGGNIQKRNYSTEEHDFRAFNFITSDDGRWSSEDGRNYLKIYSIPWVPILDNDYQLPTTVDELITAATGISKIDGLPREGIVFRSADGQKSFKAVSNDYLLAYHA